MGVSIEGRSPTAKAPGVPSFLRGRSGRLFLLVLGALALGAAGLGAASYRLGLRWFEENKAEEATTALSLVEAFVATYTEIRARSLGEEAAVPAAFRAHSIERFNEAHREPDALRIDWVGTPGRSIRTEPRDPATAEAILEAARTGSQSAVSRWVLVGQEPVFRTLAPSVATQQACVDCHNRHLDGRTPWRLGDVMGAFVVDMPAGGFRAAAARDAALLGAGSLLAGAALAAALLRLQHQRHLADLVAAASSERERAAVQGQRAAEAASQAKSRFLAMMSHELRTPLNAINGFSDMMARQMLGPLQPRYREYSEDIHRSGRHLLTLIDDILDVAKAEAGKLELVEQEVDLADLIEPCVRLVGPRAAARGLELSVQLPGGVSLLADPTRLRQIVLNLLSNAVKFTPRGGRVRVEASVSPDGSFSVCVSDTGRGMAPEDIPRAFTPFEQLGAPGRSEGTGLGLPLARTLAELHGGDIELESEPGIGTAARLRLPAHRVALARAAPPEPAGERRPAPVGAAGRA